MFNLKVLSREVTEEVLSMPEVIETVKEVYMMKAKGGTTVFPLVSHEFDPGVSDMDIKSGLLGDDVFGLKVVSYFSENVKQNLPALIGTIMVMDAKTGVPVGILDGGYITAMRTGASGAVGAKALARPESETMMIVGAGHISAYVTAGVLSLFPGIKTVYVYNGERIEKAKAFAERMPQRLKNEFGQEGSFAKFIPTADVADSAGKSDIIITATPSHEAIIKREWVKPGTHFSCVGSDMSGKQEIDPEIFDGARVFTDDTPQCINVGEIETAVAKGILKREDIAGEIGEVLLGTAVGRENPEQITVFDATGTALLDLLTAKFALAKAEEKELGETVNL